jgi:Flp pilus assembly protein TadB
VARALRRGRREHPGVAIASVIDAVAAALRSGATVRDGLDEAARAGPVAPVLRACLARADAGMGLRDALVATGSAHPSVELRIAFAAMALALDTGAAHATTLELVAQRVRDRVALARDIRAMSAAARASAWVVSLAPFTFAVVVLLVDRTVVTTALATSAGRACLPAGLALEAAGAWWMQRLLRRPSLPTASAALAEELPEVVDLLGLAMRAGHGVAAAIAVVAPYAHGGTGRVLRISATRLAAGEAVTTVLARWVTLLGDDARPLVAALEASHREGGPAADALDRIATDLRVARRQRAAERVQRLPVELLFPLVCCVLPAFVLLSVLPIALGAVGALRG